MSRINKKGQHSLEYILIFIAVVLGLFVALRPVGNIGQPNAGTGFFTQSMLDTMDTAVDRISAMANGVYYNAYANP